ncbi:DUF928 domain-containing protein [Candidatus Venteria ishoeyi]|uniref:DUF928 domain-containing protein n=1 Tax=Candidatus Venteria ishoeyi TaxID=1899563 RepID=A0A1H6F6C8_9GAMM|nr:DUF928 domain-containing protein [Candidatus Venteria ishoeyi]MDM8545432.1 DUF928 domain-containing protein [Candidatus Venteria ishoeyi]SEH04646.1 Uncharacterised protein [Candidatus Venteria ishoeyi]
MKTRCPHALNLIAGTLFAALLITLTPYPVVADMVKISDQPVYTPPVVLGKPKQTVGGATRGHDDVIAEMFLAVLATPDHMGRTIHAQPTLYWVLTVPLNEQINITLSNMEQDMRGDPPLLDFYIEKPHAGIHKLDLVQHGVTLEPDIEYTWGIEVLLDTHNHSQNISAMADIVRIQPDFTLRQSLDVTQLSQQAFIYAKAGLWYDAINVLGSMIEKYPDKSKFYQQRAALLTQVGLKRLANYDRMAPAFEKYDAKIY